MLGTIATLIAEGVMGTPVVGSFGLQPLAYVVEVMARGDAGKFGTARAIELCQLRQSDVREVLRTQP